MPSSPRRFPPPWSAEPQPNYYVVRDANRQQLAYVYLEEEPGRRSAAKLLRATGGELSGFAGGQSSDGCLNSRAAASRRPSAARSSMSDATKMSTEGPPAKARKLALICCVVCGQDERHRDVKLALIRSHESQSGARHNF